MGRIEELADRYEQHIATAWQRTIAGAQRVVMVVYDKELERTLRYRKDLFRIATEKTGHKWFEVDITDAFARWLGEDEYRDSFFEFPDDLQIKLENEFPQYVAGRILGILDDSSEDSVVGVFGVGSLYGFTSVSRVVALVEANIRGRLVIFYPGQYEQNKYRLLDSTTGWNYLAVPITVHSTWGAA